MSTTQAPAAGPAPSTESEIRKVWDWITRKVTVVEDDLAKIIGADEAAKLEAFGKNFLKSWLGPLAVSACAEATDVVTGKMSVSAAIEGLVAKAVALGKQLSQAAALQAIALAQNALPTASDATVTPVK